MRCDGMYAVDTGEGNVCRVSAIQIQSSIVSVLPSSKTNSSPYGAIRLPGATEQTRCRLLLHTILGQVIPDEDDRSRVTEPLSALLPLCNDGKWPATEQDTLALVLVIVRIIAPTSQGAVYDGTAHLQARYAKKRTSARRAGVRSGNDLRKAGGVLTPENRHVKMLQRALRDVL